MTRLRAGLARIRSAVVAPFAAARRWWNDFDSEEGQIATAGILLLAVGAGGWTSNPWVGLAIAGALLVVISLGFRLDRPRGGG
jgi:hypothetical protein